MAYRIDKEFQERLPPLTSDEYQSLKEKIANEGARSNSLIVANIRGDQILIDGHNTTKICKELGSPLPTPSIMDFESREAVLDWIEENQFGRRNAAEVWKQQQRERRVHRIANARSNGQSLRTIAKTEKVSEKTVRTDLEKATAEGVRSSPDDGKVTGADGKKRAASTPRILCQSCATRVRKQQPVEPKCRECRTLRAAAKGDKGNNQDADTPEPAPKAEPMDDLGNALPKKLRDAFAGSRQSLSDGVKLLQEVKRMTKNLAKWNPFLRGDELEIKMTKLVEDLQAGLPYAVCPACEGKCHHQTNSCKGCRNSGWVPKWAYKK